MTTGFYGISTRKRFAANTSNQCGDEPRTAISIMLTRIFYTLPTLAALFSLTPCFSWVGECLKRKNRFNGLPRTVETVETVLQRPKCNPSVEAGRSADIPVRSNVLRARSPANEGRAVLRELLRTGMSALRPPRLTGYPKIELVFDRPGERWHGWTPIL